MRRGAAAAGPYPGRRRSGAGLIVGLIVLALVGLAVWYFATHNSLAAPADTPAPSVTVTIGSPSPYVAGSGMFSEGYSTQSALSSVNAGMQEPRSSPLRPRPTPDPGPASAASLGPSLQRSRTSR